LDRRVSSYGGLGNFDTTTFWVKIERQWIQTTKNKTAHRKAPHRMSRPRDIRQAQAFCMLQRKSSSGDGIQRFFDPLKLKLRSTHRQFQHFWHGRPKHFD
jgi:hypothetical protein